MRPNSVTLLCFALAVVALGVAVPGSAQTALPRAIKHPDSVDCFAVHAGTSCQAFNDMLQAGKFTTMLTQPASKTFVCFRQQENAFVVVHYDLPVQWELPLEQPEQRPKRNGQEVDVVEAGTNMTIVEYKESARAMSLRVDLLWSKAQGDSDRDAMAGTRGNPSVTVTGKQLVVNLSHMNNAGTSRVTDYSLQINRLTKRFAEQLPVAKSEATTQRASVGENGYCSDFSPAAIR